MKARLVSDRQFNWITVAFTICSALLIIVLNIIIDPYGIIGSPTIAGFNKLKPERADYARLFKAVDVTRIKPKTILLGTSTTDFGLNPNHPAFSNYQPVYNLGMPGANMYEITRYFEHALYNQPDIKQVIIGVDLFLFRYRKNAVDFDDRRLKTNKINVRDIWHTTFSLDAFSSSVKTVVANLFNSSIQPYDAQGTRNENWRTDNIPNIYKFLVTLAKYMQGKITISEERFDKFNKIIEMCHQRNIEIKVFIPPSHATLVENSFRKNEIKVEEQEKRKLVKIISVWDFSGFNSITREQVNEGMKNYIDALHFRKNVGDLILNRLLNFQEETVPADFGFLMTPENVESHLTAIRSQRIKWQNDNPEMMKLVQSLENVNYL